jgi:hypothetical protein
MPLTVWVIRKDGTTIRKIEAREGLKTYAGVVSRVSEKSIWTLRKDGTERLHRAYDGRLPGVYQSYAPAK